MGIKIEPFQSDDNPDKWYWHIVETGNGQIIATGGQDFDSKYNAERATKNLEEEIRHSTFDSDEFIVFRRNEFETVKERILNSMSGLPRDFNYGQLLQDLEAAEVKP